MTDDVQDNDLFPIPATDEEGSPIFIGEKQLMINKVGRWHYYAFELKGGGEVPHAIGGNYTLVEYALSAARSYMAQNAAGETKSKTPAKAVAQGE